MRFGHRLASQAASLLCAAALTGAALAAGSQDPDWPCVQRKVPRISAGMVWAGPPLDQLENDWRRDVEVSQLAGTIARRAVSLEEAEKMIADFAAGLGDDRNEKLTLLFDAVLSIINRERGSLIDGIGRYARRQAALAERIREEQAKLNELAAEDSAETEPRREELRQQIVWDTRIFQEREQSLTYVCETPIMLEQRVFALSRAIMSHLE